MCIRNQKYSFFGSPYQRVYGIVTELIESPFTLIKGAWDATEKIGGGIYGATKRSIREIVDVTSAISKKAKNMSGASDGPGFLARSLHYPVGAVSAIGQTTVDFVSGQVSVPSQMIKEGLSAGYRFGTGLVLEVKDILADTPFRFINSLRQKSVNFLKHGTNLFLPEELQFSTTPSESLSEIFCDTRDNFINRTATPIVDAICTPINSYGTWFKKIATSPTGVASKTVGSLSSNTKNFSLQEILNSNGITDDYNNPLKKAA